MTECTAARKSRSIACGDECVYLKLARNHNGYTIRKYNGKTYRAHRLAWILEHGQIPKGKVIDHLCGNRSCVNVAHMEVVTQKENVLRGNGVTSENSRKTHCKRGHEFTDENTHIFMGSRHCKECRKLRDKARGSAVRQIGCGANRHRDGIST